MSGMGEDHRLSGELTHVCRENFNFNLSQYWNLQLKNAALFFASKFSISLTACTLFQLPFHGISRLKREEHYCTAC